MRLREAGNRAWGHGAEARGIWRVWGVGAAAVTLALSAGPSLAAPAQGPGADQAKAQVNAQKSVSPTRLADYARAGQFSDLLTQLKSIYGNVGQTDAASTPASGKAGITLESSTNDQPAATGPAAGVKTLISELESFQTHQVARVKQQKSDFNDALAQVASAVDRGDLENSLVQAIHAKQLANDRTEALSNAQVEKATKLASVAAGDATAHHDWVRALSLYRLLNDLHKIPATYLNDMKNASHHVEVLQVFAPKKLVELYQKELKLLASQDKKSGKTKDVEKDNLASIHVDQQPWQLRLEDVNFTILDQTLRRAATEHIAAQGYQPLMIGAVGQLQIVLDTPQVRSVFPGLSDQSKRQRFAAYLSNLDTKIKSDKDMGYSDAMDMVGDLRDMNQKTVALPASVVAYEMTEGATDTLDRFSRVIWPSELRQFSRTMQGTFYGVGIQIAKRNDKLTVISPLYGTPAAQAGVMAGDVIAEVNGQNTTGWSLDQAIRKITGPLGSPVMIGLKRAGHKNLIEVTLKRAKIKIQSILGWQHNKNGGWNYWIDPKDRIGYIRLTQFIPQTATDLDKAVSQMQASGPIRGLILDLRYNPGGLLSVAAAVADRFISHGPLVFTVDAHKHKNAVFYAHQGDTYRRFPVVVLINGGTASAAEIVTGALQDYARAEIIGTRSYGKGSVQDLFPIDDNKAYFKLTTQHYMLPLGQIIHRFPGSKTWGIQPDLKVTMTPQQMTAAMKLRQEADVLPTSQTLPQQDAIPQANEILKKGLDPQLETALLVLKTKLVAQYIAMAKRPTVVDTP